MDMIDDIMDKTLLRVVSSGNYKLLSHSDVSGKLKLISYAPVTLPPVEIQGWSSGGLERMTGATSGNSGGS